MGFITKTFKLGVLGGSAAVGSFFVWTRKSSVTDIAPTDPIWSSVFYKKLNPDRNPVTQDIVLRRVPLKDIKPELLEKRGALVEAFCSGVFGGLGFEYQRAFLARKYQGPDTADQLWSRSELQSSNYPVSTKLVDHFEIVEHTDDSILVRCGDSPRKPNVRESDGLFELSTKVKENEGVVEFAMKSCFFLGLGKADNEPMPPRIKWLHQQYAKLWMEFAVNNCRR